MDASYNSPVYPKDADYLKAVEEYFDKIMPANPEENVEEELPTTTLDPTPLLDCFIDEKQVNLFFQYEGRRD